MLIVRLPHIILMIIPSLDHTLAVEHDVKQQFELYVELAFGWVPGCVLFQMTSDTILYMMRPHNCDIFAYINIYFIIVSQENNAMRHYQTLFDLFAELGLSMNQDKLSPPEKL